MARRYAIYYAPERGSPMDQFGKHWLGRDVGSGKPVEQVSVPGVSPERL